MSVSELCVGFILFLFPWYLVSMFSWVYLFLLSPNFQEHCNFMTAIGIFNSPQRYKLFLNYAKDLAKNHTKVLSLFSRSSLGCLSVK